MASKLKSAVMRATSLDEDTMEALNIQRTESSKNMIVRERPQRQADCNYCGWMGLRYFLRHPYSRIFVAVFIVFFNWGIYAEDPIAHSLLEADLPVIGNGVNLVINDYPDSAGLIALKASVAIFFIFLGLFVGRQLIHHIILQRYLKLRMFSEEKGTWMVMFFTTIIVLYIGSHIYNAVIVLMDDENSIYKLDGFLGITYETFTKIAASGTWLGDYLTAYMVIDMMLQDNEYPSWAENARAKYKGRLRIVLFWSISLTLCTIVIVFIATDFVEWDKFGERWDIGTSEISRTAVTALITMFDLLIVLQDWEFPTFITNQHINLPGLATHQIKFNFLRYFGEVHITGKWFNYGIITIVMMLDFNMMKNQFLYDPVDFAQYVGPENRIYTIVDAPSLAQYAAGNLTFINEVTFESRQAANFPDLPILSRFEGYSYGAKFAAIMPALLFLVFFIVLLKLEDPGRYPASLAPTMTVNELAKIKQEEAEEEEKRARRARKGKSSRSGSDDDDDEDDEDDDDDDEDSDDTGASSVTESELSRQGHVQAIEMHTEAQEEELKR